MLITLLLSTAVTAAAPNAQALWDAGNYRQAFASAFEAANAGDPRAEFLLGEAYRLGRSVDQDLLQARSWYTRAARQGDVASAAALGDLLISMRHPSEAVPWLTLAASHNHPRATASLATIYYTGDGAEQDLILATSLMKKAAAEGSPEAKARLAMMDDTAPPVDVSSPAPVTHILREASAASVKLAQASPAPSIVHKAETAPLMARAEPNMMARAQSSIMARAEPSIRTQVGAFRSAANAKRALSLVSARMSGTACRVTIVQNRGYYRVLLVSEGRKFAAIARARLVKAGWQYFARRGASRA